MLSNYSHNLFLYLTEVPDDGIDCPTSYPSRPLSQQQGESVKSATPLQKHSPPIKLIWQNPQEKTKWKHLKKHLKRISPSQHCQDQVVPGNAVNKSELEVSCAGCGLAVHDLSQALQAILAKLLAYWPTWTKWTNLNSEYLYIPIKLKVNFIGYLWMPENLVETWEESRIVDPSLSPLRDLRSIASINPNKLGSTCLLQMMRLPAMSIERKCFTSSQIDLLTRPQHAKENSHPLMTNLQNDPWPRIPTCSPIASVEWQLTWNLSLGPRDESNENQRGWKRKLIPRTSTSPVRNAVHFIAWDEKTQTQNTLCQWP